MKAAMVSFLLFMLILGAAGLFADQISDAITTHANDGPHRGAAGLEDVRDLRTQIGGMVAIAVLLISGFGTLLYKQGVAELRGEIHTCKAELGGRIDVLCNRVDTQNGRIAHVEDSMGLLSERHLDSLNRFAHALSEAAKTNVELLSRLPKANRD